MSKKKFIMKYLNIKNTALTVLLLAGLSCKDDDKFPFNAEEVNKSNGAYLRTVDVNSSKFNLLDLNSSYYQATYEAVFPDASKFKSVDFYVSFIDVTEDNGTTKRDEVKLTSVPTSSFANDATSQLPRYTLKVTADAIYTALNLSDEDVTFGDIFRIREAINYNDLTFSNNNTGGDVIGGAFYATPFQHDISTADPLTVTLEWDGEGSYCETVDLDLYFNNSDGKEVTGYSAASASCPEKLSPALSLPNGTYALMVNPYAHGLTGSNEIPITITFTRADREDIVVDAGTINTNDPIWFDNDGVEEYIPVATVIKTGIDFEVIGPDGVSVGTIRKGDFNFHINPAKRK